MHFLLVEKLLEGRVSDGSMMAANIFADELVFCQASHLALYTLTSLKSHDSPQRFPVILLILHIRGLRPREVRLCALRVARSQSRI